MSTLQQIQPIVRQGRAERVLTIAAAVVAGIFVVYFAARMHAVIGGLYANGDSASALVLAQFFGDKGDGQLVLGNYAWLEPLFVFHWTAWLPHHRQAWELMPFAAYVVTIALTAWSVARAATRRAGVVVGLALLVPAPLIAVSVFAPNAHGHTLAHTALLAVFLVTTPRLGAWSRARRVAWAVALVVTLAAGASSDVLLIIGGVAGFLAAVAVAWRRGLLPDSSAAIAAGAALAGVAGGLLLKHIAHTSGVVSTSHQTLLLPADQLAPHFRMLLESLALFGHGRLGGALKSWDLMHELPALAVMVGVPVVVVGKWRATVGAAWNPGREPEQRLLLVFWAVACTTIAAAYVVTDAAVDIYGSRYLTVIWPGLLSIAAVMGPARRVIPALAVVTIVTGVIGILELRHGDYTTPTSAFPQGSNVSALEQLAQREHLDHGYAGYWEAAEMTAQTNFRLHVWPLLNCGAGLSERCPVGVHRIDTWYRPKPGPVKTFYVVDSVTIGSGLGGPPASWGRPLNHATFGQLDVYVYGYDIASRLGAPTG
jgi:hypothetical protein